MNTSQSIHSNNFNNNFNNSGNLIPCDLIISAPWIIPMSAENSDNKNSKKYLKDAALVIKNGKILDLDTQDLIFKKYEAQNLINKQNHVLLPGFINSHTHLAMSLLKGVADDLPLMTWLKDNIWPAESAFVSKEFVKDGAALALLESIQGGVTCVNDMYFYAEETAKIIHQAGIRGFVSNSILNIPMPWAPTLEECFLKAEQICEQVKNYDLVGATIAPHAPYTNDLESLNKAKLLAEKFNTPIHMHVQETESEVQQHDLLYQQRPLDTLNQLGMLSKKLMAVHMTQISESDIQLLKNTGVSVIHCPESNMKLASGACPVDTLLKNNINVALGTDGSASNNNLDMFGEMRSASFMSKLINQDPESLSAYQLLQMATINGAKALGIENTTGSLEINKSADFIAIDLSDPATQPLYNPISQLVYAAHAHQVTDSWVAGKLIMKNRKVLNLEAEQILNQSKIWQEKISKLLKLE